jgi:hypothetical protein
VDDGDDGVSAPASMTVSVVTVPDDPVIIWVNPATIVYGTALSSAQLNATADVPGTFTYDPPEGIVLAAGTGQTLNVTFTPTDPASFNSGSASVAVNVSPESLTITADSKSKTYGAALPALTASYVGFVSGDAPASLDTPVDLSTSATAASGVGFYPIVASGAADANYAITHVNGTLTVTTAAMMITAENKSKVYGQANPPLTASYSAFAIGETAADLDTPVSLSTSATTSSPVGAYPIIATGASDANYQITLIDGVLTIEPNAQVNSITQESGGRVRIRFTGLSGRAYRVEASGDLLFWATAGTVEPDSNGDGEFSELAVSEGSSARFYRLVWP